MRPGAVGQADYPRAVLGERRGKKCSTTQAFVIGMRCQHHDGSVTGEFAGQEILALCLAGRNTHDIRPAKVGWPKTYLPTRSSSASRAA